MEEILLFVVLACIAYIFWGNIFSKNKREINKIVIPEDSTLRRHFLTQLSNENAAVAAEIQKRLSL